MAEYDLTGKLSSYLDKHLIYPLLDFLLGRDIYPRQDVLRAKYEVVSKTKMLDFAETVYNELCEAVKEAGDDIDLEALKMPDFEQQKNNVIQRLQGEDDVTNLIQLLGNQDVTKQLRAGDKNYNISVLREQYNVLPETVAKLYDHAKFLCDCGSYDDATISLQFFRSLSADPELSNSALWGKLICDILLGNWDTALKDIVELRDIVDARNFQSHSAVLQQRTWLLHWSLFVFFNHPKGKDALVDMYFQNQYMNTIQAACPWLLRYLTAAVITNKRRRNTLKDLAKVVAQESYTYKDPVTQFIESLYVDLDFSAASEHLKRCEELLKNDFFLASAQQDFIECARYYIFETYCKIHSAIDIKDLSAKLNMTQAEGENWIVDLIRDTRIDAKIDFEHNVIVIAPSVQSIYQTVIEKTKGLSFRSQVMSTTIEKKVAELAVTAEEE
ncbi:eIF3 subunit 6 N terminal domain-containing protein [Paraphysoderma sedebokerense]|nr:eIF3 subunit 6 N terminal domain-containing protein [Paraphysoderma sedebokerense]